MFTHFRSETYQTTLFNLSINDSESLPEIGTLIERIRARIITECSKQHVIIILLIALNQRVLNIYKRGEHVYKTLNYYGITETRSALFLHGWPTLSIVAY